MDVAAPSALEDPIQLANVSPEPSAEAPTAPPDEPSTNQQAQASTPAPSYSPEPETVDEPFEQEPPGDESVALGRPSPPPPLGDVGQESSTEQLESPPAVEQTSDVVGTSEDLVTYEPVQADFVVETESASQSISVDAVATPEGTSEEPVGLAGAQAPPSVPSAVSVEPQILTPLATVEQQTSTTTVPDRAPASTPLTTAPAVAPQLPTTVTATAVVPHVEDEIMSGDEDAEGSIVDESE